MRIGHGLGIFVTTHDGEAIEVTIAIAIVAPIDEVSSARRSGIRHVGHIGIGHLRT